MLGGNQYQGAGVDTGNLMLNPADGTEESGSVTALQLQLALVQAQTTLRERERERASGAYAAWERQVDSATLPHQLPTLKDDDCLNFFLLYQLIMELNLVPRDQWAKYLVPQLSIRRFCDYPMRMREIMKWRNVKYLTAFSLIAGPISYLSA